MFVFSLELRRGQALADTGGCVSRSLVPLLCERLRREYRVKGKKRLCRVRAGYLNVSTYTYLKYVPSACMYVRVCMRASSEVICVSAQRFIG